MAFVLLENQNSVTTDSVLRLATRFSVAIPQEACDALEEETLDYMLLPSSVVCEEGEPTKSAELCAYWQQIGRMTTLDGTARFLNPKCILALPVSNAETERIG